jgi:hypothetical protein
MMVSIVELLLQLPNLIFSLLQTPLGIGCVLQKEIE